MSATNWRGSRSDADSALWWLVGVGVLIALMVGLRMSTRIADRGPVFDERWITRPIAEIIRKGWSVPTAIDFQETKGPAMIWPYALWGQLFISNSQEVVPEDVSGGGRGSGRPEAWTSPIPGGPAPAPPKMLATLRMFSMVCFVLGGALVMLLAGTDNIRDVIAFPKTQSGGDMMSQAPGPVDAAQLDELQLRVIEQAPA